MMEMNEEFIDETMRYINGPSIEAILSAKHLLRKPEVRHIGCEVPKTPRILTEEELRKMYGMEE